MSIRRLFWLGAAILFSIAALVAIVAVVGGDFGETQGRILATCGLAFLCGAASLSGLACLDREVIRPAALVAVALGVTCFALWVGGVWTDTSSSGYWKVSGVAGVWMLAALIVTALRLVAASPKLLRTSVPATWVAAALAAALGSVMILRENGDAWQVEVVVPGSRHEREGRLVDRDGHGVALVAGSEEGGELRVGAAGGGLERDGRHRARAYPRGTTPRPEPSPA